MRAELDLYVLDAVADDVEEFGHILERLNSSTGLWRRSHTVSVSAADLVLALSRHISSGLVEVCAEAGGALQPLGDSVLPPSAYEGYWYRITPRGLLAH